MKLTLNKVDFDIQPVAAPLRDALLADPIIRQGVTREVWRWDAATRTGTPLVAMTAQKGVPLPNGVSFFVARPGSATQKADGPSAKMAERVLEAVGAKSITDVMQAVNRVVRLPQKTLPLKEFEKLSAVASHTLRIHVDYAVLYAANAARNLGLYIFIPGQCAFTARIDAVPDQAAYDAALAENAQLARLQPGFVIPPGTEANIMLRRMALAQRITEIQQSLGGTDIRDLPPGDLRRLTIARLSLEWQAINSPRKKAGPPVTA
jgi:hypothetical protein